ncbi:hypothetical protein KC887_01250 [Candidatus Kaiserbacteria bacterium]|nr:hypothetical protein [Candidatus Kaiserbacteria bacterium]
MIEYLGYDPATRAGIVKVSERALDSMQIIASYLDDTEMAAATDYRLFEQLLMALSEMSKSEIYHAIKRMSSIKSVYTKDSVFANLDASISKLERVLNE